MHKILSFIDRRPFPSFFGLLAILFVIVVVGNAMRKPQASSIAATTPVKQVSVFTDGVKPTLRVSGKVDKASLITIVAQSPGVVQRINAMEGKSVARGTTIVGLSSNYQGGSVQTVTRQIAARNAQYLADNYQAQKDLIARQRDLANLGDNSAADLRGINNQSISDTQNLINLDSDINSSLDAQINALPAGDPGILPLKQAKAQIQAGLLSLNANLRNLQYSTQSTTAPAEIADASRDVTLKQLDLQDHALDLNKDLADLNLRLARISESLMYPASPVSGTVIRVFVHPGQVVNAGTPLAVIQAKSGETTIDAALPVELARLIDRSIPCQLVMGDKTYPLVARSIATEATDGTLAGVVFDVDPTLATKLIGGDSVALNLSMLTGIKAKRQFIPLDAVYQTQEKASVFVVRTENGKDVAREADVVLGDVVGEYVDVTAGLQPTDVIVLSRTVSDGDVISYAK